MRTHFIVKFILLILCIFSYVQAIEDFGSIKIDEVTSIYDGDTFRAHISSYPDIIGKRVPIRIKGIDTPEMRSKCIKEKELARRAKKLTVSILRGGKIIELKNMQRGRYFRIVADVYVDGTNIADILIENDLAVGYDGGTKTKDWCE